MIRLFQAAYIYGSDDELGLSPLGSRRQCQKSIITAMLRLHLSCPPGPVIGGWWPWILLCVNCWQFVTTSLYNVHCCKNIIYPSIYLSSTMLTFTNRLGRYWGPH